MRTVGNHKNLHILIQPTARPEAVTLITVNLVERLFDRDTTPLQFHMDEGQTVFLNILTKYCVFTSEDLLLVMRPYQIVSL